MVSISIVIIASWMFLVVPEIKNDPMGFEQFIEFDSRNNVASYVGGELEKIATQDDFEIKVSSVKGNIVNLVGTYRVYDMVEEQFVYHNTVRYSVDKNSKIVLGENVLLKFPNNAQKQTYRMYHPIIQYIGDFTFENVENIGGLEIYVYSFQVKQLDSTGDLPAYEGYTLTSDQFGKSWVEPITGDLVDYELFYKIYADDDGESVQVIEGGVRATEFTKLVSIQNAQDKKNLFNLYDTVIPILLTAISAGSILVVFVNQNLKIRTKELVEVRKKKTEEVLYETIPNPVVTFDKNNKLVDCNQYFLDRIGFSKDEIIGMYVPDFLNEQDKKTYRDVIQPALNEGKTLKNLELHIKKKDGGVFHSLWSHIAMRDDNNEYLGFTGIGIDLTEIDKLRDELVKKEKFEILGQLAANMAHDIKNPLNTIKQSSEIIQLKTNQEKTQKDFLRINKSITRISHQVDQVLNYIKKTPLVTADTTVLTILKQSLDVITIPNNISIEIPEEDIGVKWDETKISVLFVNIILNAIQAIGGDKGKISIRVAQESDSIKIEIENTGPNIPEKDLDKIFEPLYTTKMEGTGLGLAGCKNIIQSHNGTITASNNPVTFTVKIPKYLDDFNLDE